MRLTSDAFDEGGRIPRRYTCDGEDVSPPLGWEGAPEGTESFALVVHDPDAPRGDWVHWVIYDVPGHLTELPEDVGTARRLDNFGEAAQGKNDFGRIGWGGPCPPPGKPLSPESFDRTHSLNLQFHVRFPPDFRARTLAGKIFSGFGAYLVYNAHSGEPFTRVSQDLEVLEDFNKSRLPWFHQGDLRLTRAFQLGKGFDVEVFTSVINFLDIENVAGINPTTGQPNVTGVENKLSQTPLIPGTFKLEGAPDGFPINVDQLVEEFRDEMARQDLDGDGTITLEEAQTRLRQALQATGSGGIGSGDSPFHYGEPRQWRFGVEIGF